MIQQTLFTNLIRDIMQKIDRIKPTVFYSREPLVKWIIAVSTAVAILMPGVGSRFVLEMDEVLCAAAHADEPEEPTANGENRYITFSGTTNEESGEPLASGNFYLTKTDAALTVSNFGTQGTGKGDPSPMYMLMAYFFHYKTDLFRYPLVVGDTWTQAGHWGSQAEMTVEGYEQVDVAAGTFPDCLKHKTVFTDADVQDTNAELRNTLVNGTRYLWFAKGVGIVKMRYEHANGVITEAELLEYDVPVKGETYLPLQVDNAWTYKWQNDYRGEAIIEKCQVAENSDTPPGPGEDTTIPEALKMMLTSARYEVTIAANERRVAHVRCVLTPKADTGEILPLYMSHFGTEMVHNGYAEYLEDLTVTTMDQEELPMIELGKTRWAVKVENKSPVVLNYKVLLNHDERQWPPGRSETPYVQEDCIFLPGYALFVTGKVDDVELRVNVPDNWYVSTPWHRIGDDEHRFTVKDQDDLMYAYIVLGTHSEKVAKSGEAEVIVAVGGSFKAAAAEIQERVEAFLKAYSGVCSGTPKGKMIFVANPYGDPGRMGGGVSGRSISVLIGGTLNEASSLLWVPLVGHEVFHIWNGRAINFKEQEYWFSEGFTECYAHITSARLGFTSESDFLKNLERACELYLSQHGELSMREAGKNKGSNSGLVYQGGNLIALALDTQIRKLTHFSIDAGQKSLDDVMKQMYSEFGVTGKTYTIDDVVRIVTDIAGEDFEPFFRKYVSGTERLLLTEYLGDVGVDVKIELGEQVPNGRYVIHTMLHISSLTQTNKGLIIHRSPKGGYQDEDNLIGINDTPVKTFNDIRDAAKDWKGGDVIKLTLERNGEEITLPVTLGGPSEKPPMEAENVDVTITKRADRTELQRAIWSGMLGDGNSSQEVPDERDD